MARQVIWQPQPGPQSLLLSCPCDEVFFGGARGGGKTDGAIGVVLQHERTWGVDAHMIWFRRTGPELEGALLRMHEIFPQLGADYSVQARTWTFPSGATLKLRFLDRDQHADKYQGHEYTLIIFDELGNWPTAKPVDKLRGTLRSARGVRCQIVATGNPGGPGHGWVKARFVDAGDPLTPLVETFTHPTTGATVTSSRVYIPSKLEDNAYLRDDTRYIAQLHQSGPPHLVRAWLTGDWAAKLEGEALKIAWFKRYTEPPDTFDAIVQSWDTAETDGKRSAWSVCITAGILGRRIYLLDVGRWRLLYPDLRRRHRSYAEQTVWAGKAYAPVQVSVVERKSSGVQLVQDADADDTWPPACTVVGWDVEPRVSKDARLYNQAAPVEAGLVYLPEHAPWLAALEDELGLAPFSPFKDQADAFSQLLKYVRERFSGFVYRHATDTRDYESAGADVAAWSAAARGAGPPPAPPLPDADKVQAAELWGNLAGFYGDR